MLSIYDFSDHSKVTLILNQRQNLKLQEAIIDEFFAKEQCKSNGNIFNGKILSAIDYSCDEIRAEVIDYKYFLAKKYNLNLFRPLKILPIAVSGLLKCKDGVVFGRRSSSVTQDAGKWELAPSGGIDCVNLKPNMSVDYRKQLLIELKEEIGVGFESIVNMQTFCFIVDDVDLVLDIGISLCCNLEAAEITNLFSKIKKPEYDELLFIRTGEVGSFLSKTGEQLVDISRLLLQRYIGNLNKKDLR